MQTGAVVVLNMIALRRLRTVSCTRLSMSDAFKASRRRCSREVHLRSATGTSTGDSSLRAGITVSGARGDVRRECTYVLIEIVRRVMRLSSLIGLSLGADVSSDYAAKGLGCARAVATQF